MCINKYEPCKHCHEWPAYSWKYSCGIHNGVIECLFAPDNWGIASKRCKYYTEVEKQILKLDDPKRCKHLFIYNDANQPHICTCGPWDMACKFTDDWAYANLRCKFYEEDIHYVYKIVVEYEGVTVEISEPFETFGDAKAAIPPWMIMDFVSIRKCRKW